MQTGSSDSLPSDYYLANFHSLAGFVQSLYRDILTETETDWYDRLCSCPAASQQLYIRLLTRKGSVFRLGKLRYSEIRSVGEARRALVETKLAGARAPESLPELLAAYTKPEILRLLAPSVSGSISRADLVDHLLNAEPTLIADYQSTLQHADEWITLRGHQYWAVFTLCFFGNLYQDSSEFVLRDLGNVLYESYCIDPETRAFTSRSQIEAHMRYFECEALYDTIDNKQANQLQALVKLLPAPLPSDYHLKRRLDRFRNRVARQLERLGCTQSALSLYKESSHPPARERQIRIYIKTGKLDLAATLIEEITKQPFNDAELSVVRRLQSKVEKERGVPGEWQARFRPDTTRLTLQPSVYRVEIAAQSFYSRFGPCFYTENALVSSVLGLFIWDIIFYPVKGVFFNPFQSAPADFYGSEFGQQRAELLAKRFLELDDTLRFSARIMQGYSEHYGKSNPLVRWGRLSEQLLSVALQYIPADHWRTMFQRLLRDPREHTSGFPDLVLFRDGGDYEFIEIKGPGDTLQQNQRLWMQYFSEHRIPCRVVNVRWGSPLMLKTD